jgi:hypothetical protein
VDGSVTTIESTSYQSTIVDIRVRVDDIVAVLEDWVRWKWTGSNWWGRDTDMLSLRGTELGGMWRAQGLLEIEAKWMAALAKYSAAWARECLEVGGLVVTLEMLR